MPPSYGRKPVHGDALYLALEDNERRLQRRIDKIMQGQARWPERLAIHTEWQRFDQGGLDDIEEWCGSVKQTRLIWIDTLAKVRPVVARCQCCADDTHKAVASPERPGRAGLSFPAPALRTRQQPRLTHGAAILDDSQRV